MGLKLISVILVLLLLAGCGASGESNVEFETKQNYSMQKYEIQHKDGYEMEVFNINHEKQNDLFKQWEERQIKKENEAKYEMKRDIYRRKDTEKKKAEYELEKYCESLHSNSCLEMEWIKDHNGCRKVEVTCDENDTDDICVEYVVDLKGEYYPEDEC
ncbi:MAG: hypothetical protein ACQESF_01510 [Nanobdellota archaeon]